MTINETAVLDGQLAFVTGASSGLAVLPSVLVNAADGWPVAE
jgi:hypothetical protein